MIEIRTSEIWQPREYQKEMLRAFRKGYKRLISVEPRRSGKDVKALGIMTEAALQRIGVYWYIWPTAEQGRKNAWNGKLNDGRPFMSIIPDKAVKDRNISDMRVTLINDSTIQIVGIEKVDSLMGGNPCGIVITEFALFDNQEAYELLTPMLRGNDGWCIIVSTPRRRNSFYRLLKIAEANPDVWFSQHLTIEDTKHISLEAIKSEIERGELSWEKAQQEYFCFPGTQEVFCYQEYKSIAEVKENDLVLSHSGRPRKVLRTMNREYAGDLIEIESYGSPEKIQCTKEHPLRVYDKPTQTYLWKKAADINTQDLLVFPKMPLGKSPIISKELCMLLAWYICDGSSFKNGVQFTVGLHKQGKVCDLITSIGHTPHVDTVKDEKAVTITINSTQLVDFFKTNCGTRAPHKRIPLSLIAGHEDEFFHELMKGDGCFYESDKENKYVFTTVSKLLAYQVQMLANSLTRGYASGISIRKGGFATFPHGKTYETRDSYQVSVYIPSHIKGRTQKLYRTKYGVAARIKEIKQIHFCGKVYNIEVQYDNSYIIGGRAAHNCSFDVALDNTVYGSAMDRMRSQGRITSVPYDGSYPVYTAWDIGRDTTAIVFFQAIGQKVHIIDYYEKASENLEYFVKKLSSYPYTYAKHFFPHDGSVIEWAGDKYSRIFKAARLGLKAELVEKVRLEDGIEWARSKLSLVWMDEKNCARLIQALESYRYEKNALRDVYSEKPIHDWASHGASAVMYMSLSLENLGSGMTEKQADEIRNEALYGHGPRERIFNNGRYY